MKSILRYIPIFVAIAALAVLGAENPRRVRAAFSPTSYVALSTTDAGSNGDVVYVTSVPGGNYAPGLIVLTAPAQAAIAYGANYPSPPPGNYPDLGSIVGSLSFPAGFGISNAACASGLSLNFTLLNATVNKSSTITPKSQAEAGAAGTLGEFWQDGDGEYAPANGFPAQATATRAF